MRSVKDHSQNGEFSVFVEHAEPRRGGIVVDVGARGKKDSNSYDLLTQFGWRGLLVEASPKRWAVIEKEFAGTDFILERCAVSNVEGIRTFYLRGPFSSLLPEAVLEWGPIQATVHVQARRLGSILQRHSIPASFDLLTIDIEGMDIPVLNDLFDSTDYRPDWIWFELAPKYRGDGLHDTGLVPAIYEAYEIEKTVRSNLLLKKIAKS